MDVKYNNKKLVAIEYPGTVLNVNNMTRTFGDEAEMSSVFNKQTKRLELKFRPDDPYCKCVYGDRFNTTNLLLKVTKRVKKKKNSKEPQEIPEPNYKIEFLGVACTSYKFKSLADFQVLPIVFDKQLNKYKSLLPEIVPKELHPTSWLDKEMELFIPPVMYSRFDLPQSGYIETVSKVKIAESNRALPENIIGKCRKRRAGFAVFSTFESKVTSTKPQESAIKQLLLYPLDCELKVKVDDLFNERPIWSKNALIYRLGCEKARLKYPLPCSAYFFSNGPWRSLWVKFGYEPRNTPSSKIYQVMDLRINSNIPLPENKFQRRNRIFPMSNKTTQSQERTATINTDYLVPQTSEGNSPDEDDLKLRMLLSEYFPGQLPPARQCFYQLCDIHLESVQALVHKNDGREDVCLEKDGWCESGTLEKCRELIVADIMKTIKEKEVEQKKA